jgi:hypothetical protein
MHVRPLAAGEDFPPLAVERVIVKHDHRREESWDAFLPQAA